MISKNNSSPLYIYSTKNHYNDTKSSSYVYLHLDPECNSYAIHISNSLLMTTMRIVQQHWIYLPSHIFVAILLGLRNQINITPYEETFKCADPIQSILKYSPFFLATTCKFAVKLITFIKVIPIPEQCSPLIVTFLLNGTAVMLLMCCNAIIRAIFKLCGTIIRSCFLLLGKRLNYSSFQYPLSRVHKMVPTALMTVIVSISIASCGSLGLLVTIFGYLMMLSKVYITYTIPNLVEKKNTKSENCDADFINKDDHEFLNNDNEYNEVSSDCSERVLDILIERSIKEFAAQKNSKTKQQDINKKEYETINEFMSFMNFHTTILNLLILLFILNVPCLLTWIKNYKSIISLPNDSSLFPTIAVVCCLFCILEWTAPKKVYVKIFNN